jgi:hypothetical protein
VCGSGSPPTSRPFWISTGPIEESPCVQRGVGLRPAAAATPNTTATAIVAMKATATVVRQNRPRRMGEERVREEGGYAFLAGDR